MAPSPSTVVTFQPEQRGTGARHCGRWEIQKYTENRTWHMFQVISDKVYFNVELAHYVIRDTTHDIWPNTNGQRTKTNKFASFKQIQISANKWVLWSNSHRIDAPHRLAITLVHCDDTSTTATLIAGDLIIIINYKLNGCNILLQLIYFVISNYVITLVPVSPATSLT